MSLQIAKPLEDFTEQEWDGQLFRGDKALAPMLGWQFRYHTLRSKGSQRGFPDRVLVRDRIIYVETKSEKGKPTPEQIDWLDALTKAGAECYLWRPSDLDEAARVLSKRWRFLPRGDRTQSIAGVDDLPLLVLANGESESWTPRSIWVVNVGRYDQIPVEEPETPGQTTIDDFLP